MAQTPKAKQPEQPPPPTRRGRAAAVAADAQALARAALDRAGFSDPTLVLRWEEIAGAETARLARPLRLKDGPSGGVLTLMAEPGAAVFLQHETRPLCERINAYLGRPAVARLRFVQGTLSQPAKRPLRPGPKPPVPAADPARKYEGPEGVREALLRLAQARRSNLNNRQD
ncbi:MAG TPA: DciA family protein [Rhizomicrobium sp.]|nr:DciA family protein [Rhizomicrobium sp.]